MLRACVACSSPVKTSETMPIYAYKCESCGHSKDVLQKMSDAPLTDCPQCGAPAFKKQLTAAGFQLKGSGWYVTDFRGGGGATAVPPVSGSEAPAGTAADAKPAEPAAKAAAAPAPAAAPVSSGSTPKAS
jgi:putative FmdB family regulatory protein